MNIAESGDMKGLKNRERSRKCSLLAFYPLPPPNPSNLVLDLLLFSLACNVCSCNVTKAVFVLSSDNLFHVWVTRCVYQCHCLSRQLTTGLCKLLNPWGCQFCAENYSDLLECLFWLVLPSGRHVIILFFGLSSPPLTD